MRDILKKAKILLETEGWCQGSEVCQQATRYGSGPWIPKTLHTMEEGKPTRYCLMGAVLASCDPLDSETYYEIWNLLTELLEGENPITWNDKTTTTKGKVLALLAKAISQAS